MYKWHKTTAHGKQDTAGAIQIGNPPGQMHGVEHRKSCRSAGRAPMPSKGRITSGPELNYLNPHHEEPNQNEPTAAHPVSQHKQFKGHSTAHSTPKIPK